jgi:peptidyl-prolyl cis-trans isomerase A (cyclophilin A)
MDAPAPGIPRTTEKRAEVLMQRLFSKMWSFLCPPTERAVRIPRRRPWVEALEDRCLLSGLLTGSVFRDANANGVRDAGEIAVPGVQVVLTGTTQQSNTPPVSATVTTDADGKFSFFNVDPGTYQIAREADFMHGGNALGSLGGDVQTTDIRTIALADGQTGLNYDFGIVGLAADKISLRRFFASAPGSSAGTGQVIVDTTEGHFHETELTGTNSVAGFVYADNDADGTRDAGEAGLADVTVTLLGQDPEGHPLFRTTTSDATGAYKFEQLPEATYTVNVGAWPAGFRPGRPTVGNKLGAIARNDQIRGISLEEEDHAEDYNFAALPLESAENLVAFLNNDTAGPSGSVTDGITSDASVRGTVADLGTVIRLEARLDAGTTFTNITSSLTAEGDFILNTAQLLQIAGGTLAAGNHTLHLQATDSSGVVTTRDVAFTLQNAPTVSTAIPAVTAAKNAANEVIDLAGHFTDADITNTRIRFNTSEGVINVELTDKATPRTVANFINYIQAGKFNNTIFHRSVPGFVVQGGGFAFDDSPLTLSDVASDPPVDNEFSASRPNVRGTIAMAKTSDPDSATNEFFFNLVNNTSLDQTTNSGGFTTFGKVVGTADETVMDALAAVNRPFKDDPAFGGGNQDTNDDRLLINVPLEGTDAQIAALKPVLQTFNGTTPATLPAGTTADNFVHIDSVDILPRSEVLTYSLVSNDNPQLLTATVTNNRLTLDYQQDQVGTARVTVRATDLAGNTVDTTVTITVT